MTNPEQGRVAGKLERSDGRQDVPQQFGVCRGLPLGRERSLALTIPLVGCSGGQAASLGRTQTTRIGIWVVG